MPRQVHEVESTRLQVISCSNNGKANYNSNANIKPAFRIALAKAARQGKAAIAATLSAGENSCEGYRANHSRIWMVVCMYVYMYVCIYGHHI